MRRGRDEQSRQAMRITTACPTDNHRPPMGCLQFRLRPIALALLKRNTATDVDLMVDGIAAAQEVVVDPEVGLHVRPKLR